MENPSEGTAFATAVSAAITTLGLIFTGFIRGRNKHAEQTGQFLLTQRQMDENLRAQMLAELKAQTDSLENELRDLRATHNEERGQWDKERGRLITQRNEAYDGRDAWFEQCRDMVHDWNNAMAALQSYHTRHECGCTLPDMIKMPPEIGHRESLPPCCLKGQKP